MIVTCGGIKGGVGKTTIATNLAVMLANVGRDVLAVDADEQGSLADFMALRDQARAEQDGAQPLSPAITCVSLTGAAVREQVQRLAPKYDAVVIDTGGRDTTAQRAALTVSDVLLAPFAPRSLDVWTAPRLDALVGEVRAVNLSLQAMCFLNRTDPRGTEAADAAEILRETENLIYVNSPIGNRKAFAHAAARAQSVTELRPRDPKAESEIEGLFQHLMGTVMIPTQRASNA